MSDEKECCFVFKKSDAQEKVALGDKFSVCEENVSGEKIVSGENDVWKKEVFGKKKMFVEKCDV